MPELNWKQKEVFINMVVAANVDAQTLLNDAISWIAENLNPEDVFPNRELEKWAESEGYSK